MDKKLDEALGKLADKLPFGHAQISFAPATFVEGVIAKIDSLEEECQKLSVRCDELRTEAEHWRAKACEIAKAKKNVETEVAKKDSEITRKGLNDDKN